MGSGTVAAAGQAPPALYLASAALGAYDIAWSRATLLLSQLERGLAYNGRPRNYVNRRNPYKMQVPLTDLVNLGGVIQRYRDDIAKVVADAQTRATALGDSALQAAGKQRDAHSAIGADMAEWRSNDADLATLDQEVLSAAAALATAQQIFQDSVVQSAGDGCGFGDLITIVATIAAIYTAGTSLIATIGTAASALTAAEAAGIKVKDVTAIAKTLQPVAGDIASIGKGYQTIKGLLDASGKGALVVVDTSALDQHLADTLKAIDQVSGASPDAKAAFKAAVSRYVDAVRARNQLILQMDSLAAKIVAAAVDEANLADQAGKLHDAAIAAEVPAQEDLLASLDILLRTYLRQVRDAGWDVDRAADYCLLRPYLANATLTAANIATVAGYVGDLILDLQRRLTDSPGTPQQFPQAIGAPLSIRIALDGAARAKLFGAGLLISLQPAQRPAAYESAFQIFADQVRISLDGVSAVAATLTHLGRSSFEVGRTADDRRDFVVVPRTPLSVTQNFTSLGSLPNAAAAGADQADFLGLSPFSDWILKVNAPASAPSAAYVDLEFEGSFRAG